MSLRKRMKSRKGPASLLKCGASRYAHFFVPCSDPDALALDLLDPLVSALLRLIRLVVLVERATHEIVAADRLRLFMVVPGGRPGAHDRGTLLLEARSELVHGVAVVVRVAGLIPHA